MKKIGKMGLILSFVLVSSCGTQKNDQSPTEKAKQDQTKWESLVGSLGHGDKLCTFFVTGENQLTTAYHCLETAPGQIQDVDQLKIQLADGTGLKALEVESLIPAKDLATLTVDEDLEAYLASGSPTMDRPMTLVAYDQDEERLSVNQHCRPETLIDIAGVFTFDCETQGHYSGAPLIQDGKVVGIHLGYKEKVDRRVAMNYGLVDNPSTDVLEIEFREESCHSRAHSRGGLFGHSRAHVRGCEPNPPSIPNLPSITDAIREIMTQAANEKSQEQQLINELNSEHASHHALLARVDAAWNQFNTCYNRAKDARDADGARACQAEMKRQFDSITSEIAVLLEQQATSERNSLKALVERNARTRSLSQSVVSTYQTFKTCLVNARGLIGTDGYNKQVRTCSQDFKNGMTMIQHRYAVLNTNIRF